MPAAPQKLEAVARLALHPATGEGEWTAASIAFFRILRAAGVEPHQLIDLAPRDRPPVRMPCGKHRGKLVSDIARQDPSYAWWIVERSGFPTHLREAFAAELGVEL
jgi:uncharacterized protein (DUF3820 family)